MIFIFTNDQQNHRTIKKIFLIKTVLYFLRIVMSDSLFSSSSDESGEDNMMMEILLHLPRPRRFGCRLNPLI